MGLYNGSLTREQFMFREMRIVARLYKNGLSNAEITDTVYRDNLFQYPTERVITKNCRAALNRLTCIACSEALLDMLAQGDTQQAKQAALVAMMCQSRLLAEFMTDVIGENTALLI